MNAQPPKVAAAILAAGSGTRFGADKTLLDLGGSPLALRSVDLFTSHPAVDLVLLVGADNLGILDLPRGVVPIRGGQTRAESSRLALEALPPDVEILLVHDAARPFATADLVNRVLAAVHEAGAAAPAVPVTDTIRSTEEGLTLVDRTHLIAMQTPQGARVELLKAAQPDQNATDEMALLPPTWKVVPGDPENFKITTKADYLRALAMLAPTPEFRTGLGYDVHRFSPDASRPLMLGGVHFEGHPALEGHSDADVLIHAAVDALLGAAALGDIGQHFPPSDQRWKNEPSLTFLKHAATLLTEAGWHVVNLDLALIAESPKVMPRSQEIRETLAKALDVTPDRVSLKATTNEGLGAIGRNEGIAAFATATIRR